MDEIERLIARFRSEDTRKLAKPDKSIKPGVIESLGDYAADPRVLDFLLNVAADRKELDLARIEALKILEMREPGSDEERRRIAPVLKSELYCGSLPFDSGCNRSRQMAIQRDLRRYKSPELCSWLTFAPRGFLLLQKAGGKSRQILVRQKICRASSRLCHGGSLFDFDASDAPRSGRVRAEGS